MTPAYGTDVSQSTGDLVARHRFVRIAGTGGSVREPLLAVAYLLLVASVVPWRTDAIYEGGVDPVVIAKALISLVAFAIAVLHVMAARELHSIGLGPAGAVTLALLISGLGGLVSGNAIATTVLVLRVLLLMCTVLLLLRARSWEENVVALLVAMAVIAMVAAVTGVPGMLDEGRLGGGIPQMHPNQLAGLVGFPLIGLVVLMLRGGLRIWSCLGAAALLVILVGTGSRTALVAVMLSGVVAAAVTGIRRVSVLYALLLSLPVGYAVLMFTDVIGSLATRAGSTDTTDSVESRLVAWRVVLSWGWSEWRKWIGLGLSTKTVPVRSKWVDVQVLDSSWVSVLAQAGLIGAVVLLVLALWCLINACVASSRRQVVLPLLVLLLARSATESGLLDSALPFLILIVLSTVLSARSRHSDAVRLSAHRRRTALP